jgi:uncharacterized membrane protein
MPFVQLHYDEAEGRLPDVCMRCGARAVCRVNKTIRLYDTESYYGRGVFALVRMLIDFSRYLSSPTLQLRGPFCEQHRNHWAFRRALVWGLIALLPVVVLVAILLCTVGEWSNRSAGLFFTFGSAAVIVSAIVVHYTSIVKFGVHEEAETLTLAHVHPRFIEALEQQREKKVPAKTAQRTGGRGTGTPDRTALRVGTPPDAGSPFAELDDEGDRDDRPRSRRSRSGGPNPVVLGLSLAIGVPLILMVIVLTIVRFGKMAEAAAEKRREAAENAARPEEPPPPQDEEHDVEPGTPVPKAPPHPPLPVELVGRASIDLIPLIKPRKDVIHGHWLVTKDELHCNDGNFVPRVQLPYIPPEEYDFVVTFSQPGLRNGISLVMPNPRGGSFFWFLGRDNGTGYGFSTEPFKVSNTPGLIKANTVYTTVVQVRRGGVRGFLDGKELVTLPTDYRNLICDDWRRLRNPKFLGVACDDPTVFHYVRLVETAGHGKPGR